MMEYPKCNKVLFCTDFSKNSDYAFEFACGIAQRVGELLKSFMSYLTILTTQLMVSR